jgi:1-phosphofructokinase family hexose kinase
MTSQGLRVRSIVGVALNAAIDRIVAVGRLQPGGIHRPTVLSSVAGGKAANAVRAAVSLGLPGRIVAVLGGYAGDWYADALGRLGIDLSAVSVDGETRTCTSILDRSTGELTEFYEPGLTVPDDAWPRVESALIDALGDEPEACLVLLAGSLPPDMPDDAYRRLGAICAERGAPWAVDAAGSPLLAALEARPWLVKVNEREAAETLGRSPRGASGAGIGAVRDLAQRLLERGAGNALLTRGLDGAVLQTDEATWTIGRPPVSGPFSVGSGDALVAGLAVALSHGLPLAEAVRFGSAVAAANALVPGQGVFDPGRVDEILAGISLIDATDTASGGSGAAG